MLSFVQAAAAVVILIFKPSSLWQVAYILHDNQHILLTSRGRKFTEGDAFIGYQKDTPAAVVFQATQATPGRMEHISVPGTKADEEEEEVEDSHIWKEDVSSLVVLLMQWQRRAVDLSFSFFPVFF